MPLDLQIHAANECRVTQAHRFEREDPYFQEVSEGWSDALRDALAALPEFKF
jgi:putative proteasome-type protease